MSRRDTVGIIVGGGPAPGINGVISSAVIEAVNEGKTVLGIRGGFKSLFDGNLEAVVPLCIEDVSRLHTQGGSILKTSRDYPDRMKEKLKVLMGTLKHLGIRYLITIGGEGSLYMATLIEREARGSISLVHVPKTIDNDIPMPGNSPTFGYETARHWGVEIVRNIIEDATTTGRWYFIATMGRNAGHLALGIGKAAGSTLTVIGEEFPSANLPIRRVADILTGSIIKRLSMGRNYGVAILAEGITEKLDNEELSRYEPLESDETGRIRLSEIQLGRVMKSFVKETLEQYGIKLTIMDINLGYELRAAGPIPFDIEYTRNLGYGAVRYLLRGGSGAMIVFDEGRLRPIPFVEMIDHATGKIRVRTVDIASENYEAGRKYMIRLEKEDFAGDALLRLAKTAKISPEAFRERFLPVVA